MPMPMVCTAAAGRAVPTIAAAGGSTEYTYVNGYKVYTFKASGVLNILRPAAGEISYLVVGGGGAGGCTYTGEGGSGGGGGGGARQGTAVITAQQAVTVAAGGTVSATNGVPTAGGSSSIGAYVTAYGGGFGAWSTGSSAPNLSAGGSGATGGGASFFGTGTSVTRIPGTGNAGKNGGTAFNGVGDDQGGGGGGSVVNAGQVAADAAQNATGSPAVRKAGNGGTGFNNDWTGVVKGYGGGGGGGASAPAGSEDAIRGVATHGGGAGIVTRQAFGLVAGYSAVAGTPNTGGGGGGGGFNNQAANRGAPGGSGVVILRHRF